MGGQTSRERATLANGRRADGETASDLWHWAGGRPRRCSRRRRHRAQSPTHPCTRHRQARWAQRTAGKAESASAPPRRERSCPRGRSRRCGCRSRAGRPRRGTRGLRRAPRERRTNWWYSRTARSRWSRRSWACREWGCTRQRCYRSKQGDSQRWTRSTEDRGTPRSRES